MSSLQQSLVQSLPGTSARGAFAQIHDKLKEAQNVLLVGVGGGNDSVTSLLLPAQFRRDFGFNPERLQIAAMLPDVLDYQGLIPVIGGISEITSNSKRSVGERVLKEFPEPLLALHKEQFGIDRVLGLSMERGSNGLCESLHRFIEEEKIDLVLACDVGGDFIATPQNLGVLSPMMDAYALSAFRRLQDQMTETDFVYCVFGLGTDGESTPTQLRHALSNVGMFGTGTFEGDAIKEVNDFYRHTIEHNRRSRTADFTLRSIYGEVLETTQYRARFHTQPSTGDFNKYYGNFSHAFDPDFSAKYYLFEDLSGVVNPFELNCINGLEWFIRIQNIAPQLNHEMNGQSYACIESLCEGVEGSTSIFFGTPSFRFSEEDRMRIVRDVEASIENKVFDTALILKSDVPHLSQNVRVQSVGDHLAFLSLHGSRPHEALLRSLNGFAEKRV